MCQSGCNLASGKISNQQDGRLPFKGRYKSAVNVTEMLDFFSGHWVYLQHGKINIRYSGGNFCVRLLQSGMKIIQVLNTTRQIYFVFLPVPIKRVLIRVASLFSEFTRWQSATLAKRLGQIDVRAAENGRLSKWYPKDHSDPLAYSLEYPVHMFTPYSPASISTVVPPPLSCVTVLVFVVYTPPHKPLPTRWAEMNMTYLNLPTISIKTIHYFQSLYPTDVWH